MEASNTLQHTPRSHLKPERSDKKLAPLCHIEQVLPGVPPAILGFPQQRLVVFFDVNFHGPKGAVLL